MKNKKLWLKLLLDLVMFIVLALLFRKNNFGMKFHEIAGLIIFGVFVLHIILNWRWVYRVTSCFFNKDIKVRTRISWLINLALLICFILIGLSGIFISKVLFNFSVKGNWKVIHFFCSAISIILVGIHLGLHLKMILSIIFNKLKLNHVFKTAICGILVIVIVVSGVYSIKNTSFVRWITMPFGASMGDMKRPDFADSESSNRGERPQGMPDREKGQNQEGTSENTQENQSNQNQDNANTQDGQIAEGQGMPERPKGDENFMGQKPPHEKDMKMNRQGQQNNISDIIIITLEYISIMLLISLITQFIDTLINIKKGRK